MPDNDIETLVTRFKALPAPDEVTQAKARIITELRAEGMSYGEIGELLGIGRTYVASILRRAQPAEGSE